MKHAGAATLDQLEPLLEKLRKIPGLVERKRGIFYRGATAFLHFHEDPAGIFVDIRAADGKDFDRLKLDAAVEAELLTRVKTVVA